MGWERRQRGGRYFYRSVRVDGRPRKVYLGNGPAARAQARLDQARRRERHDAREALRAEQARLAAAEVALDGFRLLTGLLLRATLLLGGLHEHRGEWRRRRGRTT